MSTVTEVTLIVCSTLVTLAAMSNISDVLKSRRGFEQFKKFNGDK